MRKLFPLIVAMAAGTCLGFLVGQSHEAARYLSGDARKSAGNPLPLVSAVNAAALSDISANLHFGKGWQPFIGTPAELLERALAITGKRDTTYFLFRALEEIPPDQLPRWAAELSEISEDRPFQLEALEEVQRLWAQQDPEAALAWARSLPPDKNAAAIRNAISHMSLDDPRQALGIASSLKSSADRASAISDIARRVADSDPATAFEILTANASLSGIDLPETIFKKWACKDPQAAAASLKKLTASERQNAATALYQAWAERDPAAAMNSARELIPADLARQSCSYVAATWAQSDPKAAADWFAALPPGEKSQVDVGSLASSIMGKNPEIALGMLGSLQGVQRINAISEIASAWASRDVKAAFAWANSLASSAEQRQAFANLAGEVRDVDATTLLSMSSQISSQSARVDFLKSAFSTGRSIDSEKLIAVLNKLEPDQALAVLRNDSILSNAAQGNPEAAAKLLISLKAPAEDGTWSILAEGYASKDPSSAYTWAESLPSEYQEKMMPKILSKLAESDGPGAFQKALLLSADGTNRGQAIASVISSWSSRDPDGFSIATQQMKGEERIAGLTRVATMKSWQDPEAAATYLQQLQSNGRPEDAQAAQNSIPILASKWARVDPKQAAAAAGKFPPGPVQDEFISNVAMSWASSDPMNASVWIKGLPPGNGRDGAVESLVGNIGKTDPDSALIWASQIKNAGKRERSYDVVLSELLRKDPSGGRQAVNSAPISAEAKQRLLQR